MKSCTHSHRADILVCRHVADHNEAVVVLLVDDDGKVDWALCRECALVEHPYALPCISMYGKNNNPVLTRNSQRSLDLELSSELERERADRKAQFVVTTDATISAFYNL